ncbi:MAG: UDP-N-acetylglucosamine--N-acetylmuramyl-(pentapeptide) pyrophosphoryl-undecaprenol N-acetylglucosamine transferase, partial [Treponema sp.]|nr:UDP-N-acetylglucosamine--N-acetylmuramyl-(pentapeptide) pyrophosphoryl-undecaprenol N-acetylglucosamine transferase [Treponema sp.]
MKKLTIAFAGGGTGGHIYPGLAVADEVRSIFRDNKCDVNICWIGSNVGMDKNIVEKNIDANGQKSADNFFGIPAGKLRRYFSLKNFFDIFKIVFGFFCSIYILRRIKPVLLFSKGGFVSVPPCLASRCLKIPVFTHECDFSPGLATKINSKFANKILLSYKETANFFAEKDKSKTVVVGNPIRPIFYASKKERGLHFLEMQKTEKPILLVLGGSSGSLQINNLVYENLSWLCTHFVVVHQRGLLQNESNNSINQKSIQKENAKNYKPYDFIYEQMSDVIAASDIVLSRSGANSIWECAVLGKPLVLIPLSGSGTRGDQVQNASFFEKNGAAFVMQGENVNSENLKNILLKLLQKSERERMA